MRSRHSPISRRPIFKAALRGAEAAAADVSPSRQPDQHRRAVVDRHEQRGDHVQIHLGVHHMKLVIIGAGFAGMYAALSSARLRDIKGVSPDELEITLVAPERTLVVRPRLYEPKPETLTAPLLDVLKSIDVVYVQGSAETIDTTSRTVEVVAADGAKKALS